MLIDFEEKSGLFVISCEMHENNAVMAMPERRFRKQSRKWAASALRRNIEYMAKCFNNEHFYTPNAWQVFKQKLNVVKGPVVPAGVPSWYQFKNPPRDYQLKSIARAYGLDCYGLFFEQGLGKTFTAINLSCLWRMNNDINAVAVVCPSSVKLVWEEELEKHSTLPYQCSTLEAGKYKKADAFINAKNDFPWFVVGIEALSTGSAREYLKKFLASHRCAFLIDESSGIKTPNTLRTDACLELGAMAKKRVVMSGTSITQGIEDLYTQLKFLSDDITGYDSFYSYRSRYCVTIPIEVKKDQFVQKIIGYQNEKELLDLISPYVSRVEKKDALDLPEKIFQKRYVEMSTVQKKMYSDMKHELFVEYEDGGEYVVNTILEKMLRLSQITGGFYPVDDGEKVVPRPIEGKNPKIEELAKIVEETDGKLIVWCMFRHEVAAICKRFSEDGVKYVEFHGGCSDDGKKASVQAFRNDPSVKVFIATKAAAYGLTLIEASTAVYFGTWYSLDLYAQSQDRVHRIGQTNHCNYIHLLCPNTADLDVLKALQNKTSVAEMFYNSLKEANGDGKK